MMFPGRNLVVLGAAFTFLAFATGYFHWNSDPLRCFKSKKWRFGEWGTLVAISRFEVRTRLINYDCAADEKFDTRTQEIQNTGSFTEIVPKTIDR